MKLPFELWVALRYLRSARRDAFSNLLSQITAGGLALGVAALILALAALSGFQSRLLSDVLARTPQLQIEMRAGADPDRVRAVAETVGGVAGVQELLYGRGWLREAGGDPRPVEIVGIEQTLPRWLIARDRADLGRGLWISTTSALRLGALPGDILEIVSPRMTLTPRGPQPRSRRLRVAGLHDPGRADERFAERVALPLDLTETLIDPSDRRFDVELEEGARVERVAAELERELAAAGSSGTVDVVTWRDANRALLFVLRLEKGAIFLAVALIVLVASFALVAALSVVLASKRAELGALAAMGGRRGRLRAIFLLLGAMLAAIGTSLGGLLGVGAALACDRFGLLRLPPDVYIVDHVPFSVRPLDVAAVLAATLVVTAMATVAGARAVGGLEPVEAMRQ